MVRYIVVFYLMVAIACASIIDDKIKNLIGEQKYSKSKRIIDVLLGNKSRYIKDNRPEVIKLLKVLKKNGFMNISLKKPTDVTVEFATKGDGTLFLKVMNNALNSIGFSFYMTKEAVKKDDIFLWAITLNTEYLIDPVVLSSELKKYGCYIEDVAKKDKNRWRYQISLANVNFEGLELVNNATYKLKKPIKPYWLLIDATSSIVRIDSFSLNRWHPYIVFFDKGLRILSVYKSDKREKSVDLDIPKGSRYMLIDDAYSLNNIRVGLKIYTK